MGNVDPVGLSDDELHYVLWKAGQLSWLLDEHQLQEYRRYREWEGKDPSESGGLLVRTFGLDWARRTGKSTMRLIVRAEDCIQHPLKHGRPGSYRYASAFQKDVEEIVDDVSRYVFDSCPPDLRPEYKSASKARPAGFYFPEHAGGSVLLLVGLDKNPNGLRGRSCDGDDISEAAFVRHLVYTIKNVLYPQYQGRPWARMCVESSAPEEPDSDYDTVVIEDCKKRRAYSFATIEDNPRLSERERREFIQAAGGRGDPDCEREYFGKRARSAEVQVCPAFDREVHVAKRPIERPEWALCYVIGDAGWFPDFFAWIWGWVDYTRGVLVIKSDWIKRNAGTKELAEVVEAGERQWFEGIKRWNGSEILQQWGPPPGPDDGVFRPEQPRRSDVHHRPYARILDGEPRLRSELGRVDGIPFLPANNEGEDTQFKVLNRDFTDMAMEIDPGATNVIAHIDGAYRGQNGKLARSDVHGHFDAARCAAYFSVMANRHLDPKPPAWVLDPKLAMTPAMKRAQVRTSTDALNEVMRPRTWKPPGKRRRRMR